MTGSSSIRLELNPYLLGARFAFLLAAFSGVFKLALDYVRRDVRVVMARRAKNHVIVCGLGRTGLQIVENLHRKGKPVVVVTRDAESPEVSSCERRGVAVLQGDGADLNVLNLAGLQRAQSLIVTCGSDSTNVDIALRAQDARAKVTGGARSLKIVPELRNDWFYSAVRSHGTASLSSGPSEILPFNLNVNAARLLLDSLAFSNATSKYVPPRPLLVIGGFGQTAIEIVMQAAGCNFAVPGQKLSVLAFDEKGQTCATLLNAKYPNLSELVDFEFVPCSFALDDLSQWANVESILRDKIPLAVIVALQADEISAHTALEFRDRTRP